WDNRGIVGVQRFIERYWTLATEVSSLPDSGHTFDADFERARHKIIRRITGDMARFRFNTAVAAMMEYLNALYAYRSRPISGRQWREAIATLTLLMAPVAPFVAEEVWQEVLGRKSSVHEAVWPEFDESLAADEQITIVIQVNGKLRDKVVVPADTDEPELRRGAMTNERALATIGDRPVREVVVVPGRLVNIVTG